MQMKITVHSQSDENMTFTLEGVDVAYANALRRLMMGEVPTMAIEDVTIFKNDSVLYDEIIAHRLGLVVLKTDLDSYKLTPKGEERIASPEYELKLSLQVEGPKNVYAKDLLSKDPAVQPVYGDTLLVKLLEGQSLELEATAVLGTGNTHSKWSPGLIWYSYEPVIKVNNKLLVDDIRGDYPPQIFAADGTIDVKKISTPQLVDACANVHPDVVDITYNTDAFRFTVESFGALRANDIVLQAITAFEGQLTTFEKLVKEL